MAVIAEEEETTVNWTEFSTTTAETALSATTDSPFFINSSATIHISPFKSDFHSIQPIAPKAIKGVRGSTIAAHGVGCIKLYTAQEKLLNLEKALYVPKSAVQLISVSHLSTDNNTYSCFDNHEAHIIDRNTQQVVVKGPLVKEKGLYTLNLLNALTETAYTAQHSITLETWHRWLGHTNYQAIHHLARNHKIKGALNSLSATSPKCNSCILGKQTRTPVPKVRDEGCRGKRRLKIVWVDLMGPVNVQSRSGNHYILDIVDDYSNMAWSILLKSKDGAFSALKAWELSCENKTGLKIGKYRTGFDGELYSKKMDKWLKTRGTSSKHGAPYTSAHTGRVERMHCTLMGKARSMRIDSGCPEYLWDEFYLTATHLHSKLPRNYCMEKLRMSSGLDANQATRTCMRLDVAPLYSYKLTIPRSNPDLSNACSLDTV